MARRVFLHIGAMKSATSYLQYLFDYNRQAVVDQGLLWTRAADNFLATDDLLGTRRQRPGLDGAWQRLADRIAAHDGDALISNELLASVPPRKRTRLVSALSDYEVQVVITARDLGRVVPSQWQTSVRNRGTTTWRDFVSAVLARGRDDDATAFWRRQDLPAVIERWGRLVPTEQITLVTVPPRGSGPAVLGERFAGVFGVDATGFEQPPYTNPSLGGHSAELLRRLNLRTRDLDWQHYKWAYKNGLARIVLAERDVAEPPIVLDASDLARLGAIAREMCEQLAGSGVRVVGDLGDLVPADGDAGGVGDGPGGPVSDPAALSDHELLETAVDGLLGMGDLVAEVRIEHEALVYEIARRLGGVGDEDHEWAEFVALGLSHGEPRSGQLVTSRFIRWRLERWAAAGLVPTSGDDGANPLPH